MGPKYEIIQSKYTFDNVHVVFVVERLLEGVLLIF